MDEFLTINHWLKKKKMREFQSLLGKANWTCLGSQCSIPNPGSQNIHALLSFSGRFRFILWSSRIAAGPGLKFFLLVLLQRGRGRWVAPVVEWDGWGLLAAWKIVGVDVWVAVREKIRKSKVKPSAWKLLGEEILIWEAGRSHL